MYRAASVDEIPKIVEMKYKMFEEMGMENRLLPDFHKLVREDYTELYLAGTAQHFVVEQDSEVIACAGAFIRDDAPYRYLRLRTYGLIGDVFVERHFRRRGYARMLTNATLEWLSEKNIRLFRLHASNAARHLYESLGFTPTPEMGLFR